MFVLLCEIVKSASSEANVHLLPRAKFWIMVDFSLEFETAYSAGWPANLH